MASALDGQNFRGIAQEWTARVHGIHRDGGSCWIQVSKEGDTASSVVVRCSRFSTPAHVAAVLAAWVPAPARALIVVPAMALA